MTVIESRALRALASDEKSLPCSGCVAVLVSCSLDELNLLVYWKQKNYSGFILQAYKIPLLI